MYRATPSFSVLQATAAIAALAILLWSVGLPSLRFAEAANVISFSDTLSTSEPSVAANHTVEFVTPTGLGQGEIITLTFPGTFGNITNITEDDIDLTVNGVDEDVAAAASGPDWGVSVSATTVSLESGTSTIGANATVTIEIGTNATHATTGVNQITNPGTTDSYEIDVDLDSGDTGSTRVAIVDTVTVTASVDTLFTFTVSGVTSGTLINTADSTGGDTTATAIPFGELAADTASTAAQNLAVETNAANGFVVTVVTDQQLTSANGADIDGFRNGNFDDTPTSWEAPGALPSDENTYGHWGLSSDDTTVTEGLTDLYSGGDQFVSASSTPVEVFRHDAPTSSGSPAGEGSANVIYKVEISALQEAANDYTATLTYVATPVF